MPCRGGGFSQATAAMDLTAAQNAEIRATLAARPRLRELGKANSYGSTGWRTATYSVSQVGTYLIGFPVFNRDDAALPRSCYSLKPLDLHESTRLFG